MTEHELYWLAGLLEGEGSFLFGPPSQPNRISLALQMTDEDVVRRAALMMGEQPVGCTRRNSEKGWKPLYYFRVRGKEAAAWMKLLLPLMGLRRSQRIREVLAAFVPRNRGDNLRKLTAENVLELKALRAAGWTFDRLAEKYKVTRPSIRSAFYGETFKDLGS